MPVQFKQLHLVDHPVIGHLMATVRDRGTPPAVFREAIGRLGQMLAYEATRDLPTETAAIQTPLEKCRVRRLTLPLTIVPILRAGLAMAEGIRDLVPEANMGHLGMFRDEQSLQPVSYYERLPQNVASGPVLLVDPMLATGGSAVVAMHRLKVHKCKDVRMICVVASPEGVRKLSGEYPRVPIYAAALDRELNDVGYILPGLGDAGDRVFGT